MKVKSIGILAGIGGLAIGTVVSGIGATVLLSNKDKEILDFKEENRKLADKIKVMKAEAITSTLENSKIMGEMNEELANASTKLSEALESIDNDRQTVENLKEELGLANKNLREAHDQLSTRVSEINKLKEELVNSSEDFDKKLKEKEKEITKLKTDIKKLNKEIEEYKELKNIKEAMEAVQNVDKNLDEAKKMALEAEKKHKSLSKKISKNNNK